MARTQILLCNSIIAGLVVVVLPMVNGIDVGQLPNLAHGVSGTLEFPSTDRIIIRDFNYDGQGPDAFLYYFPPGVRPDRRGQGGVAIPIPPPGGEPEDGAFVQGRRFTGQDILIPLPSGTTICDIGTLTIWCRWASQFFTSIDIPTSLFANNGAQPCTLASDVPLTTTPPPTTPPTTLPTTPPTTQAATTPPRPSQPSNVVIGELPNLEHDVSGTLEFVSTTRILLRDFSYDGAGPDAFLYYFPPGETVEAVTFRNPQGVIIPVPGGDSSNGGAFLRGRRYEGENILIDLPAGTDVCDISTLTIWCRAFGVFFTRILVPTSTFVNEGEDPCRLVAHQVPETEAPPPTTTEAPPMTTLPPVIVTDPTVTTSVPSSSSSEAISTTSTPSAPASTDAISTTSTPSAPASTDAISTTSTPSVPASTDAISTTSTPSVPASTEASTTPKPFQPSNVVIGRLPDILHDVGGTLEFISTTRILLRDFSYDGEGPDAFLYYYPPGVPVIENTRQNPQGIIIPVPGGDSSNGGAFLRDRIYEGEDVVIDLPAGTDVCDISTLTIWCRAFGVFFTRILVPASTFVSNGEDPCRLVAHQPPETEAPPPSTTQVPDSTTQPPTSPSQTTPLTTTLPGPRVVVAGELERLAHGVRGKLKFTSLNTIVLKDFHYDGAGPDTFIYYYEPGDAVLPNANQAEGVIIPVPGGNPDGSFVRGTPYQGEDIPLVLPSGVDVCDIGTFTIWCRQGGVFFGRLDIPRSIFVDDGAEPCRVQGLPAGSSSPPTSSPSTSSPSTSETTAAATRTPRPGTPPPSPPPPPPPVPGGFENCAPLGESLQLSWTLNREAGEISYRICGCQSSDPNLNQYMAFGLSGKSTSTFMEGADATVAWVDKSLGAVAQDYHIRVGPRTQCRRGEGVCPDVLDSRGTCTNDVIVTRGRTFLREQCVDYKRPLRTNDTDCDLPLDPDNTQQYIVWAVGGIEETALRHFIRSGTSEAPMHLGRSPLNECAGRELKCDSCAPFEPLTTVPEDGNIFRARIGPAGSARGYVALTGQASWGIAWYINDVLVPELEVKRGRNYIFIVEGGDDSSVPSRYHPFYITDDPSGGRLANFVEQRQNETVYAGFTGEIPTGIGKLCQSEESRTSVNIRERCGPLDMYIKSLETDCPIRIPGVVEWRPDENTPDVVYYQCATHRNLGWRIRVVDDDEPKGGNPVDEKDPVGVVDQTGSPVDVLGLNQGQSSSLPTAAMLSLPVLLLASVLTFIM